MNDRDRLAADIHGFDNGIEAVRECGCLSLVDRLIALGWRYEPDTDEDWCRLRKIEEAARAIETWSYSDPDYRVHRVEWENALRAALDEGVR